jgi:small GTP-binding protein
MTLTIKYI